MINGTYPPEQVKADCEDSSRLGEILAQANAVKKQPLIEGQVYGSNKPRTMALSISPGTFGPSIASGQWMASNQASTMYRITTDFWGGQGQVFGSLAGGGGSIARASLHANASLIGANGTFPDLDMCVLRCACTINRTVYKPCMNNICLLHLPILCAHVLCIIIGTHSRSLLVPLMCSRAGRVAQPGSLVPPPIPLIVLHDHVCLQFSGCLWGRSDAGLRLSSIQSAIATIATAVAWPIRWLQSGRFRARHCSLEVPCLQMPQHWLY